MTNKKKPDTRVPNPLTNVEEKIIFDFFNALPSITSKLYSISTDDVKGFKKTSAEEDDYITDVVTEMSSPSNLVASNVKVANIEASRTATKQFEKMAALFNQTGQLFARNSMQSDSYGYQQAAIFESDVQKPKTHCSWWRRNRGNIQSKPTSGKSSYAFGCLCALLS